MQRLVEVHGKGLQCQNWMLLEMLGIFPLGVHHQAHRDQGWDNCVKFSAINTIQNSFFGLLFCFNDYSQTGGEIQVNRDSNWVYDLKLFR